jgi:1-aminocyclopropane-1-carboxylate deaminase/D-cysteine desulfhydrase-like pyridoxal-dependent ACC family enzyme
VSKKTKPKSKASLYLSIGTTLIGTVGVARRLKEARAEQDTLRLADAVISAASIATSLALLVRELRRLTQDGSDVTIDDVRD